MPRITPQKSHVLIKVFKSFGFSEERQRGSHLVMSKPGIARPIIIPIHDRLVSVAIIHSNLRTANITRNEFLRALSRL